MELGLGLMILFAGMGESRGDSSLNLSRSVKCCCKFNSIIVSSMVTDCPNLPSSTPNGKGNETGSVEGSKHHFTCDDGCSLVGQYVLHCNNKGAWNGSVPCVLQVVYQLMFASEVKKVPIQRILRFTNYHHPNFSEDIESILYQIVIAVR